MAELKPGWKRVKFGEIAECVNDRVDDPAKAGVERYVGLEHLDPESLAIRRWGTPDDVESTKLRFGPGDIIFGKRRAYQRKLAVADFEGICSAHAMVLRAKPGKVAPEFLPFFMQSDIFMERALAISVGSLSPTINWKTLADEEFALPPLNEQHRIGVLLAATSAAIAAAAEVESAASRALSALRMWSCRGKVVSESSNEELHSDRLPPGWRLVRAEELSTELVTKGETPSSCLTSTDTGIPFIKVYNLTFNGNLDFTIDPTFITADGQRKLQRSSVLPGDVLMNIVGPPLGKVAIAPDDFPESNINQAIVRYRPRDTMTGLWLTAYLLSPVAQNWLIAHSKKTSGQQNLTLEMCRKLPVPLPPDSELAEHVALFTQIFAGVESARTRVKRCELLHRSVREQLLGGA